MTQCEQNHNQDHLWALERLYREHDRFIQSVIRFYAKNQADREDIYQEVFLTLMGTDLEEIQDLKSYLYRLIINKSKEFLRNKISRELKQKKYLELYPSAAIEIDGDMEDLIVLDEVDGMIDLIHEYLSEKESEAILLRFKYHYEIDEAAEKMDVQRKTLIHYVSVGLKKLRLILKSIGRAD
jgi:RNA polymerase sigma factor (sigma-70 family)